MRVGVRGCVLVLGMTLLSCTGEGDGAPRADSALTVGQQAPAFELPSVAGGEVRLSDYLGQKPVLLYFSMGPG